MVYRKYDQLPVSAKPLIHGIKCFPGMGRLLEVGQPLFRDEHGVVHFNCRFASCPEDLIGVDLGSAVPEFPELSDDEKAQLPTAQEFLYGKKS